MVQCNKFSFFKLIVIICVINIGVYRFFFYIPNVNMVTKRHDGIVTHVISGGNTLATNGNANDTRQPAAATSGGGDGGGGGGDATKISSSKSTLSSPANSSSSTTKSLTPAAVSSASNNKTKNGSLPLCPLIPPRLVGNLAVRMSSDLFETIAKRNPGLMAGGRYKPTDCVARHRVAIIIPYRNREEHLKVLLNNLHPMLMRQQLDYGIFVVNQLPPSRFNRAMLMNIGYAEAMKRYDYQCGIFHDVDLIPENDRNIYSCPQMPRHMSAAIDKYSYRLPYSGIYGGVSAINKKQFESVNGFSNKYFGWGGEDDDMSRRIRHKGYKISRYPMDIARYKMIKHLKDKGNEKNPQRFALLKNVAQRMPKDGLNSLKYEVKKTETMPTHLRLEVDIDEKAIMKS